MHAGDLDMKGPVSHLGLWVLLPWMSSGCYVYAHFTSINLALQKHPLGEKNHIQKSSNRMKENINFDSYF